jgi:micrococcal nuclease
LRCVREVLSIIVLATISLAALPAQRDSGAPPRRDLLGKQVDAKVTRVADGDSLEATLAGESRPLRIRLEGIDAPEQGEAFSREALAFLRTLVFAQAVRVAVRDIDRYGRLVARVTASGTDASVALVRAGLACHAYARDASLAREESQARGRGVGFWAPAAKKPACVVTTSFSARRPPPRRRM